MLEVGDPAAAARVAGRGHGGGGGQATPRLYRGVLYSVDRHGQTAAYVDGYLVAGDEQAVRDAIDVARGDRESLAATGALDDLRAEGGPGGPLALARVDLGSVSQTFALPSDAFRASGPGRSAGPALAAAVPAQAEASASVSGTLDAALFATPGSLTLETAAALPRGALQASGAAGSSQAVLGRLPADSLLAFAVPGFGPQFARGFEQGLRAQSGQLGDPGLFRRALRSRLGFDPVALLRSLGDLGFFVAMAGGQPGGAAVFGISRGAPVDRALAAAPLFLSAQPGVSVERLPAGLPPGAHGFGVKVRGRGAPLLVAGNGRTLALAYGAAALDAALDPSETLAGGSLLRDAGSRSRVGLRSLRADRRARRPRRDRPFAHGRTARLRAGAAVSEAGSPGGGGVPRAGGAVRGAPRRQRPPLERSLHGAGVAHERMPDRQHGLVEVVERGLAKRRDLVRVPVALEVLPAAPDCHLPEVERVVDVAREAAARRAEGEPRDRAPGARSRTTARPGTGARASR